jgi:uncharacterized protein YjiK
MFSGRFFIRDIFSAQARLAMGVRTLSAINVALCHFSLIEFTAVVLYKEASSPGPGAPTSQTASGHLLKSIKPTYSLGFFLPHALRWLLTGSLLVALGFAVYIGVRFYHIDNQLYRWWIAIKPAATAVINADSLPLHNYRMDIDARAVTGVDRNLSGLAFNNDRQQLIAVINRPATLLTMDLEGRVLHRHRLRNATDVEAVAYLGNNRIALTEEGRSRIIVATLPSANNIEMDLRSANSIELDLGLRDADGSDNRNAGFEGLGYDQKRDYLYVVKEHSPRGMYRISGIGNQIETGQMKVRVENLGSWLDKSSIGTDLSSVDVNDANGHVLLLSEESQSIVELDKSGVFANSMQINDVKGNRGGVPQAEGLALGQNGTLYMISEPNLFYRMTPVKNGI